MNIVLPDGSVKGLEEGATVADVAASIGAGLARAARRRGGRPASSSITTRSCSRRG